MSTSAIGIRNIGAVEISFSRVFPLGESLRRLCVSLPGARHFSAIRSMPRQLPLLAGRCGIIRFRLFWGDGASLLFLKVSLLCPSGENCLVGAGKGGFCDLANLLGLGRESLRIVG